MVKEHALVEVDLVGRRLRLKQRLDLTQKVHGIAGFGTAVHEELLLEVGLGEEMLAVRVAAVRPGVVVDERMVGVDHRAVQSLLARDAVHALETGVLGDFVVRVVEVEVRGVAVRERREHALVAETARPPLVLLVARHREGDRERLGQGCVFAVEHLL